MGWEAGCKGGECAFGLENEEIFFTPIAYIKALSYFDCTYIDLGNF